MINRLYTASRLLSATSSYKLRPQGMAAQETGYKLQAAGPATRSWLQLCVAGYMPGSAACWQHRYMQLHPAASSYKLQARKGFSSESQLQATVAHGYTSPGTGFFCVADLGSGSLWPKSYICCNELCSYKQLHGCPCGWDT